MTRNQKIALGCGGGGCLGLILLFILIGVLSTFGFLSMPWSSTNRNYNFNVNNSNRNSNSNSNFNHNSNSNSDSDSSSASSMSTDDKHKLFQAAAATNDSDLTRRVWTKLGLLAPNGAPNEEYGQFVKEHISWLFRNSDFMESINTPEKARAYVDEHIED